MGKVTAFLGSPRPRGYSSLLVQRILEGARSKGMETVTYNLNGDGVRGCQGCFRCRSCYGCAQQDSLQGMYEDIRTSDGIIMGTPIYFGTVSGQTKLWLDRLYPMYGENFIPRHPGKKIVTVYAQANSDPASFAAAIENTDSFFTGMGWHIQDSILVYGDTAPGFTLPQELLDRAYAAGEALAGS